MIVTLNNGAFRLPKNASIANLMEQLPEPEPNTVVSVNHRIICSKTWEKHELQDGDKIMTFQLLGGG